eukprot:scaffold139098_cov66-Cyclotella_meneghiniana.AAC.1
MEQREAGFKQQHPMNDERQIQIDHNSLPATLERYSIISAVLHTQRTDALYKFRDRLLTIITTPTHSTQLLRTVRLHDELDDHQSSNGDPSRQNLEIFVCQFFSGLLFFSFHERKSWKSETLTLVQLKFEALCLHVIGYWRLKVKVNKQNTIKRQLNSTGGSILVRR